MIHGLECWHWRPWLAVLISTLIGLALGCSSGRPGVRGPQAPGGAGAPPQAKALPSYPRRWPLPLPERLADLGLRRGLAVGAVRLAVDIPPEIADQIEAHIVRELSDDPYMLVIGPDVVEPLRLRDQVGPVRLAAGDFDPAEMANLARRLGLEFFLGLRVSGLRVDPVESGSFTLPLPGLPIPSPVPVPGLPGVTINSRKARVTVTLEGMIVDANGQVVFVGRGRASREDKTSRLFGQPESGTTLGLQTRLVDAAVDDLLGQVYRQLGTQNWTARLVQTPHGEWVATAGSQMGLREGDTLQVWSQPGWRADPFAALPAQPPAIGELPDALVAAHQRPLTTARVTSVDRFSARLTFPLAVAPGDAKPPEPAAGKVPTPGDRLTWHQRQSSKPEAQGPGPNRQ